MAVIATIFTFTDIGAFFFWFLKW